uniref:Putative secreted protein n=1 Tax=Anopheles triannulatus TaxID=58253 RepID=A0A2M4B7S0_9DIPT
MATWTRTVSTWASWTVCAVWCRPTSSRKRRTSTASRAARPVTIWPSARSTAATTAAEGSDRGPAGPRHHRGTP